MSQWYIAKKKTAERWQAYEVEERPSLRRGYEMKGPYNNLVECLVAANQPCASVQPLCGLAAEERNCNE